LGSSSNYQNAAGWRDRGKPLIGEHLVGPGQRVDLWRESLPYTPSTQEFHSVTCAQESHSVLTCGVSPCRTPPTHRNFTVSPGHRNLTACWPVAWVPAVHTQHTGIS